jgi:hypothetical protein
MQQWTDWTKWELYHYVLVGGVVVALLAVLVYFIPSSRIKVPALVISGLGFLAAGFGIGMVTMVAMGYHREGPVNSSVDEPPGMGKLAAGNGGAMKMGMGGRGGRGGRGDGGMGGGRGGGGGRGPNSKAQLAALVDKLDLLTSKPLAIDLPADKKGKVAELLQGLDQKDELSEEDAKTKLDALAEQLKDYKGTLEAAGYRWPGEGAPRPAGNAANPFKEEAGQHLKALQDRLKGKAK